MKRLPFNISRDNRPSESKSYLPVKVHESAGESYEDENEEHPDDFEDEDAIAVVPVSLWTMTVTTNRITQTRRFFLTLFVALSVLLVLKLHHDDVLLSNQQPPPSPTSNETTVLSTKDEPTSSAFGGVEETTFNEYFYYNLSCPLEWSKYSCSHHGHLHLAEDSLQEARQHQNVMEEIFQTGLPPKSRVLLVGDSTMRQLIIAMGCVALSIDPAVEYTADWRPKWRCHGTPNCVQGGQHSGFARASLRFPNGAEVHFVPLGGSINGIGEEKNIVRRFSKQVAEEGRITFGPNTAFPIEPDAAYLNRSDTLILNIGLHNRLGSIPGTLKELADFADALRLQQNRPKIVYMTTLTQHFDTPNGQYNKALKGNEGVCLTEIDVNPRAELEREILHGHVDQLVDYDDVQMGSYHIGGRDCTHYCMPGPPDYVAARLMQAAQQPHP